MGRSTRRYSRFGKHRSHHQRRLRLEPLEDRRLLDGTGLDSGEQAVELFGLSPALFVENQGQWADESVRFLHQGDGANVAMTDAGPVFQLFRSEPEEVEGWLGQSAAVPQGPSIETATDPTGASLRSATSHPDDDSYESIQIAVNFDGANAVEPVGLDRAETVYNYFIGEESNWRTEVPAFETVAYPDLYDGIDLLTWGRRDSLKYEFRVAPGADYTQIAISYDGITGLSIDAAGALRVETELGPLVDDAPFIYQMVGGNQVEVAGEFRLIDAATYTFNVTGDFDPNVELVIDPDLAWATYLGGSGYDIGRGIALDGAGNALVTGGTSSSGWATGGFGGGSDAFVAKLSPSGSLIWATYLGGSSGDYGEGIAVDGAGNALVTGYTVSSGWASGGLGGYKDGFVAKISPAGGLTWATYLGGSGSDWGHGIALDGAGNALVTGRTYSSGWASGGYGGNGDAFVAKISPGGELIWATYLGGSDYDRGNGIAVDGAGNALVTGWTNSSGWASGGYGGGTDAFVAKISPGGGLTWATYLGGSNDDRGYGIAVDGAGNALVTGLTYSSGWASGGFDGGGDAFVAKISPSGGLTWATYLGGSDDDHGWGIAVDGAGNALVTGRTKSSGWATGAYGGGNGDAFVAKLSPSGGLIWATYLGGSDSDVGYGIALDGAGNALVTGTTSSSDWASGGFGGGGDAFVAKLTRVSDPTIVGHHVFYNNSAFDGDDPGVNVQDDGAMDADKRALLPGNTATAANVTSYGRGINGIMIDVATYGALMASDFVFRVGNVDDPVTWTMGPWPAYATIRAGAGIDGSDRVTLLWVDGAIRNTWLEVTIKANDNTGLLEDHVFYFGNAIGETGNEPTNALVNAADVIAIRDNPRGELNPAGVDNPFDINRDARVDAVDLILARNNATSPLSALRLITPRVLGLAPASLPEGEGRSESGERKAESGGGMAVDVARLRYDRDEVSSRIVADSRWWDEL